MKIEIRFATLLLSFLCAPVFAQEWIEGQFQISVGKGSSAEDSFKISIQQNKGQLLAKNLTDKSQAAIKVKIMSREERQKLFKSTIDPAIEINCATMDQLILCRTPQDLPPQRNQIKISKGYFGIVPDLGFISVSKI
jgi:hypothetical protein